MWLVIFIFGDWETLQKFLKKRGYPPYSINGNLDLREIDIESLGNLVSVGGFLDLRETQLSKKYSKKEIKNMINVVGDIYI
jgi:broad-specificity NMP kinase